MPIPWTRLFVWLWLCILSAHLVSGNTNPKDAAALNSLKQPWQNTPPSWGNSNDPCGGAWTGVNCSNSRVIGLTLPNMGIKGVLSGDIGQLDQLTSLDLSFNKFTGTLTPAIGNLKELTILILVGCGFTGKIPQEIGQLSNLTFLALNSNSFTGEIPATLGSLSNLYWLDLAENQLTGTIPVSTPTTPGLDQLHMANHFHFNKNQLSGNISAKLFSTEMVLLHILFDSNQLSGEIPTTVGLVQTLEIIRLDRNSLSGVVPSTISNLTRINELHLANNQLIGPVPNLTTLSSLNYVDLSNNSFDASEAPTWFSTIPSLTTLVMENGKLSGQIPQNLFNSPQLEQVQLMGNSFNGTLDMGNNISPQLTLVDLRDNSISSVTVGTGYTNTLELRGNPVCSQLIQYCHLQQQQQSAYSTPINCGSGSCSTEQSVNPENCECAYPYEGQMIFRAPFFSDLSNSTRFKLLEQKLWTALGLSPGSVSLQNIVFNSDGYLQVQLKLFPASGQYFNYTEIGRIGFDLTSQNFKPPNEFGPCIFIASPYVFQGRKVTSISTGVIIGIAIGCALLVLGLLGVGIYALRQKKRAERAIELSKPFASWGPTGKDSGGAPQLKGARWFSFDELKKCTNSFSENNEIGSGGYGKVYRGMVPGGQMVAIKRSQQGAMQGVSEFKNEIELLSRVHHKNLVSLIGFCFEQGEQMLVYEFIPNGTLRESLSGRSGIYLDWKKRLRIALSSARGLSYLHELANPPIIHRDVKTTNILLDENLTAKVADFGLSKLVSDSGKGHVSTQVKGTLGYLDPEYYMTQQLTEKSDVYSFGVVMLELITAKQPIEKGKYIVREVRMVMNKNEELYGLKEIMDPAIRNATNLIGFGRFLELAMQCVEESAADRPTMSDLVKEIETILQNDGMNSNNTSASSSATDFGSSKGPLPHPYNEPLPRKDEKSDPFDYSGGYTFPSSIEPK
ncbi:leucine-rich repeat receptor protein kinase HPCA1-like [Tasmannia lanceolata]|uniref:leucine-rich repeat receptor protein kinase HPCA1-like n=1 Tax=Tasmannia lanceolata TaxID=3420 RepID=UPI0040632710